MRRVVVTGLGDCFLSWVIIKMKFINLYLNSKSGISFSEEYKEP